MASAPIVISSSPTHPDSFSFDSSSPGLPTLEELLARKKAPQHTQSPTRTKSNPPSTLPPATAFASRANQFLSQPPVPNLTSQDNDQSKKNNNVIQALNSLNWDTGTIAKPTREASPTTIGVEKVQKPRRIIESTKQLARKRRQKKPDAEQTVLEKGKVTKSISKTISKEKPLAKKGEKVSRHFPKPEAPPPLLPGDSVGLDTAPARRVDWTPPRDTTSNSVVEPPNDDAHVSFQSLVDSFGNTDDDPFSSKNSSVLESTGDVLKKRKVIDLVNTNDPRSKNRESPRPKATKKKARTLTELATSAYAADKDPALDDLRPAKTKTRAKPVPKFLSYDGKDKVITRRGAGKAKKTSKPAPTSKEITLPILLSPAAAIKQAGNQDFVFGTSSQLAREKDTSFLKDMQTAIKESTRDTRRSSSSSGGADDSRDSRGRRRLWMAGARDEGGELLDVIDLVDASDIPEDMAAEPSPEMAAEPSPEMAGEDSEEVAETPAVASFRDSQSEYPDIYSTLLPTPAVLSPPAVPAETPAVSAPTITRPKFDLYTDTQLAREISSYGFKSIKRRAAMISLVEECWESKHGLSVSASQSQSFSTTAGPEARRKAKSGDTVAEPKSPARRGPARPTKTAASSDLVEVDGNSAPKPKRGRPKKNAETTSVASSKRLGRTTRDASPPAATTARGGKKAHITATKSAKATTTSSSPKRKKATSSLSKTLVILDSESDGFSDDDDLDDDEDNEQSRLDADAETSLLLTPSETLQDLCTAITTAVTMAPRSTDLQNPSWYEKMLMYDPIIIEDLAVWLNSGILKRVGCDRRAELSEVKWWCERNSVCCLWRTTQQGKERKRV